jgi:hypothetical protein
MADAPNFAKLVPGFDFLQGLVKNAGSAIPGIGQWVAPTLDPEELDKRIEELRTVQFWLEQNARMLGATIQALEVQRMTLSTLRTMNVQMDDLRESMRIRMPETSAADEPPAAAPAPAPRPARARAEPSADAKAGGAADAPPAPPGADPMQWWGALTRQFTQLAANAMKESAADSARQVATSMVKQSFDAAGQTLRSAAAVPGAVVRSATGAPPPAARKRAPAKKGATRRG